MKHFLLAGILLLIGTSCAANHQNAKQRESLISGVASFEHKWEEVYNAIVYVIMHSEKDPIKGKRQETASLDFVREVRTIYWLSSRHVDLTIIFILDGPAITTVEFLLPYYTPQNIPDQIIDESRYLVEKGVEAYHEKYAVEERSAEEQSEKVQENTAWPLGVRF